MCIIRDTSVIIQRRQTVTPTTQSRDSARRRQLRSARTDVARPALFRPALFRPALACALLACVLVGTAQSAHADASSVPTPASTRASWSLSAWTTADGLPQNSVTSVLHSRDGYLWLGTFGGLARFDGVRFQTFGVHASPSLPSNRIVGLAEDAHGAIWVAHQSHGVSRWHNGRLRVIDAIPRTRIYALKLIGPTTMLCAHHGGVTQVDTRTLRGTPLNLPASALQLAVIELDAAGVLWMASLNQIFRRDPATGQWALHALVPTKDGEIYALHHDPWGLLWVGTGAGLLTFPGVGSGEVGAPAQAAAAQVANRPQNRAIRGPVSPLAAVYTGVGRVRSLLAHQHELLVGGALGLAAVPRFNPLLMADYVSLPRPRRCVDAEVRSVRAMTVDRRGAMWMGSDGGGLLCARRQRVSRTRQIASERVGSVMAVSGDGDGGLWYAQQCGRLWHQSGGRITPVGQSVQAALDCVRAIFVDPAGRLWVGHKNTLSQLTAGRIISSRRLGDDASNEIAVITSDHAGAMWVGTDDGLVRLRGDSAEWFGVKDGLVDASVHALLVAKNGDVWAGSMDGLTRIRGRALRSYSHADGLPRGRVRAIHQAPDGAIWVGTYGGGLARVGERRLTPVNTKHGLAENYVSRILPDKTGRWWLLGNRGLHAVSWRDLQAVADGRSAALACTTLREADGMAEGNGGGSPAGWMLPSGVLYVPTVDGLARLDPATTRVDTRPPTTHIERVTLANGREIQPQSGEVVLHPPHNSLHLDVVGLHVSAPRQVRLRHRLEGYETLWSAAHDRRRVTYTNLEPGSYHFEVQAKNLGGAWERVGAQLRVRVLPAWWQTTLARAATLALLLLLAWLVAALWSRRQRRLRDQLEATVAKRTAELALATQEAERQASEAAQANRAKSDFLAWMSHELRTPLISVVGFAELLRPTLAADSTQRQHVDAIATSGQHLLDLINDLLDLAMIESRNLAVVHRPTPLRPLVRGIVEMLDQAATLKGLCLELHIDEAVPGQVSTDPKRLRQILLNVIGNAVKFTREGHVSVRIEQTVDDTTGAPRGVRIVVSDSGIGIAATETDHVFERFHRASDDAPGTGLGLSISHQLVELLGGTIRLESVQGQGTTVTMDVPMTEVPADPIDEPADPIDAPAESVDEPADVPPETLAGATATEAPTSTDVPAPPRSFVGARVLVVDDVAFNRLLITSILEGHGFVVEEAASGEAAIEVAQRWRPALVCMDLQMPGMGGAAAATRLRQLGHEAKLLVLTASVIAADGRDTGALAMFDGVLTKPFQIEPFLELIGRLLAEGESVDK